MQLPLWRNCQAAQDFKREIPSDATANWPHCRPGARGLQAAKLQQEQEAMSRLQFCMRVSLLAAVTATIFTAPAAAQRTDASAIYLYQGADRDQRLLEAAKKEGTLTFYTSMQTPESGPLSAAFEKKYSIKVNLWRATSDQVVQRAITEARGNRNAMDVVETNAPEVEALAREGVVAAYFSPHFKDFPERS